MVNEIEMLPSNSIIIINIKRRDYKIYYIDYKEKSIPLESDEGIKIIDKWVDKWGYIIRSLKKKTNNIAFDLSAGFDTRLTLSILLNSGINPKEISIHSIVGWAGHEEDLEIATNISKKLGLKINDFSFDKSGIKINVNESFSFFQYLKFGFNNIFVYRSLVFKKPNFYFTGYGGEFLRAYPIRPIKKYIELISNGYNKKFYNSSIKICNRTVSSLKNHKTYSNDYEISAYLYLKGRYRHHFGKSVIEQLIYNSYILCPLIDPDIIQINFNINENSTFDLISYIYVRYSHNILNIPFDRKRKLCKESIKKAELLNMKAKPYKSKINFNKNFYIDDKRYIPLNLSPFSKKDNNIEEKIFNSSELYNNIIKLYDIDVYNKAKMAKEHFYKNSLIQIGKFIKIYFDNQKFINNSILNQEKELIKTT